MTINDEEDHVPMPGSEISEERYDKLLELLLSEPEFQEQINKNRRMVGHGFIDFFNIHTTDQLKQNDENNVKAHELLDCINDEMNKTES
jgi:hypothetical protein